MQMAKLTASLALVLVCLCGSSADAKELGALPLTDLLGCNVVANEGELVGAMLKLQNQLSPIQKSFEHMARQLAGAPRTHTDKYDVYEIAPKVFFFRFAERSEVTRTFVRIQEHYENPEFRGRIFTLNEFRRWYTKNYGRQTVRPAGYVRQRFSYYEDWSGFNVPSYALNAFYDGRFTHLTAREKDLLNYFEPLKEDRFYVIASFMEDHSPSSLKVEPSADALAAAAKLNLWEELLTDRHEISHAFYYMFPEYKARVDDIISRADSEVIRVITKRLKDRMYADAVMIDELGAYIGSQWQDFVSKKLISLEAAWPTIVELNIAFEETFAKVTL